MNKKKYVAIAIVLLFVAVTLWAGSGWIWNKVLEMHGIHR